MKIIETPADAQRDVRDRGHRRVLVPTMGALHEGHLELIRLAHSVGGEKAEVVVSIFVNPLQFEPGSDFDRYPRPAERDAELCRAAGVHMLFRPIPGSMYFADRSVTVEERALSRTLCGRSRPGHFEGVCTVVAKLFNLLAPDAAVFGEKDFQQLAIVRRMVRDLDFPVELIAAPIVREADGLAMSSRNQYLSAAERAQAPVLREALLDAVDRIRSGETSARAIIDQIRERISSAPDARIDYVEAVDPDTLEPVGAVDERTLFAVAVFFGKTRLIDNAQAIRERR